MFYCIALSLGIISGQHFPYLFGALAHVLLLFLALLLWFVARYYCSLRLYGNGLAVLLAAFVYSQLSAQAAINKQLDAVHHRQNIQAVVRVVDLPVRKGRYTQFTAEVLASDALSSAMLGERIALKYYSPKALNACDEITAMLRLKQPHGLANPMAFDYEAHLLEREIRASGYIREVLTIKPSASWCLHGLRQQFKQVLLQQLSQDKAAWLLALGIGDKSLLNTSQRQLLTQTGVGHLFVISGLHIGLAATACFVFIMLLRRLGLGLIYRGDWRPVAYCLAFLGAAAYAMLAGFTLPTQRALIMLLVFFSGNVLGVTSSVWTRYFIAMALLLLLQPQAILSVGFVLSFAALAAVLLIYKPDSSQASDEPENIFKRYARRLMHALFLQCVLSIALLPLMAIYFLQWPLLSPLANAVAIPVVSLLVVPLLLLGLVLFLVTGQFNFLLGLSSQLLSWLMQLLASMQSLMADVSVAWPINTASLCLLMVAAVLLCIKRSVLVLCISLLLIAVAVITYPANKPKPGELWLDVIDVGQGLSILLQTHHHVLLYDVGAKWQSGSMVHYAVMPVLKHYQIQRIDKLIISHHDNDHKGDYLALFDHFSVGQLMSSEALPEAPLPTNACQQGEGFMLDGISFRWINDSESQFANNSNDRSCVLLIEAAGRALLLTGDISSKQERRIQGLLPSALDVVIAPHHGSASSSSNVLVSRAKDAYVVFSSGFVSRFKHPHPKVIDRYEKVNSHLLNTAEEGLIHFSIAADGAISQQSFRRNKPKYWRTNKH